MPPRPCDLLHQENVTFFAGVPTMYWGLLGALTEDVDVEKIAANLRVAVSGGASLPVEIIKQFKDRFHVQILEGYGLSETSPLATFADPDRDPRPGSIGVPDLGGGVPAHRQGLERPRGHGRASARSRSAATTS